MDDIRCENTPPETPSAEKTSARAEAARLPCRTAVGDSRGRGWLIAVALGVIAFLVIGCGSMAGDGGRPEATQTLSQTLSVGQRPTLVVHDAAGNVTVTRGGDGKVVVQVTKRVSGQSGAEARRILDSVGVDVTRDDNSVTVQTRFPDDGGSPSGGSPSGGSPTVDVQITAPQASQLDVTLTAGNVTIREIAGQMTITTTAGAIEAQNAIFAGASRFSATSGDITLDGVMNSASLLEASVTAGNVALRLPAPISAHLDARTDAGTVTVSGWQVGVTRVGTTGAQAVGDFRPEPTDQITVRVHAGNITVAQR